MAGQAPGAAIVPDLSDIPDARPGGRAAGPGGRGQPNVLAPARTQGAGPGALPGGPQPDLSGIPDQAGALRRFGSEVLRTGVVEPAQGLAATALSFSLDPLHTVTGAVSALLDPTAEHLRKATEIRTKGSTGAFDVGGMVWDSPEDFAEWATEMIRAVPIVGQVAGGAADAAAGGDVAGGVGQMTGAVGVPAAVSRLAGRVQAVKGGQVQRVPLTRAERTGGAVSKFWTDLTERTVAGAGRFAKFREEQQLALQREADLLATAIDLGERSGADTGMLVQRAVDRGREALRARGTQLYGQLDQKVAHTNVTTPVTTTTQVPSTILDEFGKPMTKTQSTTKNVTRRVGGAQPRTDPLRQFAEKELKRLGEESELIPPQELARTRGILESIANAPDRVTFKAMQDARSDLLKIGRSYGDPVPGKAAGVAKQLAGRMDAAMENAARQLGGQGLVDELREANATWEQLKTVYNNRFIKRIAQGSPEKVAAFVRAADVDQITMLKDALPVKTYDVLRGRIMRDLIGGATEPPPVAGNVLTQLQNRAGLSMSGASVAAEGPTMSAAKIRQQLRVLGPAKVDVLFGPNAAAQLEEIASLADRVSPQAAKTLPSLMAGGVNATIFSPFLKPLGVQTSVPLAAATYAGFNALAQVLTRPQGLTSMRAFARALATNNGKAALLAGLNLSRQLAQLSDVSRPEVAEDMLAPPTGTETAPEATPTEVTQ